MRCTHGPDEPRSPNEVMFKITHAASTNGARLGLLRVPNRTTIETPHYIAAASRGVVPHLTPDNHTRNTGINGVYMALEDFVEKKTSAEPPIYKFEPPNGISRLRAYTGLNDDNLLVLGARRTPPIACPASSTNGSLSILTSVGFRQLETKEFQRAATLLQPDILIALGDIPHGAGKVSAKRTEKITDRTTKWMVEHVKTRQLEKANHAERPQPLLFAPLLPSSVDAQRWYIEHLVGDLRDHVDGLAFYDSQTLNDLPGELCELPRLAFTEPKSPGILLREIKSGIDVFTIPFIGAATDAGIALDFAFPPGQPATGAPQPLGIDMWQPAHAVDVSPLTKGCKCYACSTHHRAYMQHLLLAKEMLGWVLLQIHNHQIMDMFFAGVRNSIANGTFEEDGDSFERYYEPELPAKTGQGPRVRGYQFKSDGPGEQKRNPAAYTTLDDRVNRLAEAAAPTADADAEDLENQGFAKAL